MDREHSLKTLLKNETPTITAHNQNLRLAGRLLRPVARTHPVSEIKKVDKTPLGYYSGRFRDFKSRPTCLQLVLCCPWRASSLQRLFLMESVPWSLPELPPEKLGSINCNSETERSWDRMMDKDSNRYQVFTDWSKGPLEILHAMTYTIELER